MDDSNTNQIKSQNNKDQPKLEKSEEDKKIIKKEENKDNRENKENKKDSKEEKSEKKEGKEVKDEKKEPPKEKTIDEKYKDALSEIKKLKENNMYLQAEMENTRKVTQKRMEMAVYQSRCDTIQQFLPIIESIDSAISRLETSNNKSQTQESQNYLNGFKQVQTQLMHILQTSGVKPIDKVNIPFSYKEHEVVFKLEDDSKPEDTVVQIVQKGWYMGDNILRPAKVVVSKKKELPKPPEPVKEEQQKSNESKSNDVKTEAKDAKDTKDTKETKDANTKDTKDAKSEPPKSTNCSN